MGIGFVFLIQLILIGFLGGVFATVSVIITFFSSKKETRKCNILTAIYTPFVGLYIFYVVGIAGSIIVSEINNVDIGIGDTWYVPLPNNCKLLFIDIPEQACIKKNGQSIISDVSHLQQIDNKIIGKTIDNKYFIYNTDNNDLRKFASESDFKTQYSSNNLNFQTAIDFYSDKKSEIAGISLILVGIVSLIMSIVAIYIVRKIIVRLTSKTTTN